MIDQLPPELAKLIAAEKVAPAADQTLRTVVRAKLAASVAGAPLGVAAGGLGVGKVLAILAIVAGAGTVAVVKSQHAPAPVAAVVAPRPPVVAHVESEPPTPPASVVFTQAAPVAAPPSVPSQAELLRDAWLALSHDDAAHALELAMRDARAHSNGALSEERDALHIVALAKLGRMTEAAATNTTFTSHYPNSIHRELIDKALAGAP